MENTEEEKAMLDKKINIFRTRVKTLKKLKGSKI